MPVFLPGESPWTEEPGGLQSMGLQRAGRDWATEQAQRSTLGSVSSDFLPATVNAQASPPLCCCPLPSSQWLHFGSFLTFLRSVLSSTSPDHPASLHHQFMPKTVPAVLWSVPCFYPYSAATQQPEYLKNINQNLLVSAQNECFVGLSNWHVCDGYWKAFLWKIAPPGPTPDARNSLLFCFLGPAF